MSRALNTAAQNFKRLVRSTSTPDGFRRGRAYSSDTEILTDDVVGEPIVFTPEPRPEIEDRWSRLAVAVEVIESHPLVKRYGFPVDTLITDVDGEHPVAMGFEVLSLTLAACQAADELSDLGGTGEVANVIGWTGKMPSALKGFGAGRLFRHAGALQARIAAIKAERARPAARLTLTLPSRAASRQAEPASPISTALLARIEAGKKAAVRLNSPGATQRLNEALATTHSRKRAERLLEEAERMLRTCEATARTAPRPAAQQAQPRPIVGKNGKTERTRLKALVKAGRMTAEEYTKKTGYSI